MHGLARTKHPTIAGTGSIYISDNSRGGLWAGVASVISPLMPIQIIRRKRTIPAARFQRVADERVGLHAI